MGFNFEKQFVKLRRFISKEKQATEQSGGFFPPRIRDKAKELCLGKSGRLLEVGCGEGFFLQSLADSGSTLQIIAVDSSPRILDEAARRLVGQKIVKIMQAEAKDLPFPDENFSTVVCLNMLYNLPSKQAIVEVITEMARVCSRGGSIIFDVRNQRNPLLYFGYKWIRYYNPSCAWPVRTYRFEEIKDILDRLNFSVSKKIPIGFPFNWLAPVLIIEAIKE